MKYVLELEQRKGMRDTNQDNAAHDSTGQALLLTVADGMSGYHGGEIAAEIAVGSILHSFATEARPTLSAPATFLDQALLRAHEAIHGYARQQDLPEVPRTVIVSCILQQGRAWWSHVGDARLYLLRNGQIEARTRDHTPVQALVEAGEIPPEQAYAHPDSSRVLQSLGGPDIPTPGPGAGAKLQAGDLLLLCSDGFWGPLRTSQLLAGFDQPTLRQSILGLADKAERRAGTHGDNLTVLALSWHDDEPRSAEQPGQDDATTSGTGDDPGQKS